jgi:hypothetical protein
MRYQISFLSLILIVGMACSKPKTEVKQFQEEQAASDPNLMAPTTTKNKLQPPWVDNCDREGKLTAVGIAKANPLGDISLQRSQAINRGMALLANKLEAQVETLYQEVMATAESGQGKKVDSSAAAETRNIIRNLVKVKVRGTKTPSFWTDRQTGTLFVLVQLNDNASFEVLKAALKDQPLLQDGMKQLDAELRK